MCGIAGIVSRNCNINVEDLKMMSSSMSHRGPDDEGFYILRKNYSFGSEFTGKDSSNKISNIPGLDSISTFEDIKMGLIHRRFSIIDTSILGHQPMISKNRGVSLTFNGEIFNYIELKKELKKLGYTFSSDSDTEVVLNSYIEWGLNCFNKFNGFWAIAIHDSNKNKIVLSRDRFGQKPLYYYEKNDNFYFSSEIKTLRSVNTEINKVDYKSAFLYLFHDRRDSLTPSMFFGVRSIPPSSTMTIDLVTWKKNLTKYWDYPEVDDAYSNKSEQELASELNDLISDAVRLRLRADVPVAANLSGGLDSASIVYHASNFLNKFEKRLTTHTFDYKESNKLSEKKEAKIIAESCNSNHEVLYFNSEDIWSNLDTLVEKLEEPVHSPAAYIQWQAWDKIAKMGYKVVLHGSANDELMMGYSYFAEIMDKFQLNKFNIPFRMQGNSIFYYKNILRIFKWILKGEIFFKKNKTHNKNYKIFNSEFLEQNCQIDREINRIIKSSDTGEKRRLSDFKYLRIPFWNNFMDKSMMSIPLEVRLPFLDKNIVEFCFKNHNKIFYNNGWSKYLLRLSVNGKLPDKIVWNNRKKGFTSPTKSWLIKNKSYNINLISKNKKQLKKIINLKYIISNYDKINTNVMWRIINFTLWIEKFKLKI